MTSLYDNLNDEPWYCPTCMIHTSVTPIPGKHEGQEVLELFCPRGHFVTRMLLGEGERIDETAYGHNARSHTVSRAKPGTTFFIALTEDEIKKVRDGGLLDYHFHDLRFQKGRITFLVCKQESLPQKGSRIARQYMKQGDVQPIVLSDEELERIIETDGGLGCPAANTDLQVCVITEKARKKTQQNKEKSTK